MYFKKKKEKKEITFIEVSLPWSSGAFWFCWSTLRCFCSFIGLHLSSIQLIGQDVEKFMLSIWGPTVHCQSTKPSRKSKEESEGPNELSDLHLQEVEEVQNQQVYTWSWPTFWTDQSEKKDLCQGGDQDPDGHSVRDRELLWGGRGIFQKDNHVCSNQTCMVEWPSGLSGGHMEVHLKGSETMGNKILWSDETTIQVPCLEGSRWSRCSPAGPHHPCSKAPAGGFRDRKRETRPWPGLDQTWTRGCSAKLLATW